jgi:hypothetical protein
MASLSTNGYDISFTMPLSEANTVSKHEHLLSLKFNFYTKTMYVEQELYSITGKLRQIVLL